MKRAFTLVEMLIVVVLIGILAGLGMPQYFKTKEHALGNEAIANLKLISAAEKIHRMETGLYYPSPAATESDAANINSNLKLMVTESNWDYAITTTGNPVDAFSATAYRNGTGGYFDCQYNITQASDDPAGTASCP